MGFATGIVFILLMRKMYKSIAILVICIIVLFILETNESKIFELKIEEQKIEEISTYRGEGKPYNFLYTNNKLLISDFDNGLFSFENDIIVSELNVPSPIVSIKKFNDRYLIAHLIDTRFLFIQYSAKEGFSIKSEFFTKGQTKDYTINNEILYVIDSDSGLTVFPNPTDPNQYFEFKNFTGFRNVIVDSTHLALYSKINGLEIVDLKNGLPVNLENSFRAKIQIQTAEYLEGKILYAGDEGLGLVDLYNKTIGKLNSEFPSDNIYSSFYNGEKLFFITYTGTIREVKLPLGDILEEKFSYDIGFIPNGIETINNKIFLSKIKSGRLNSIFDAHLPANFSRIAMWTTGLKIFLDYPFFGVGDISVEKIYRKYKESYYKEVQGHFHNNYIHILVILGVFGFVSIIFLFLKIFLINIKITNTVKGKSFIGSYALGAAGCFISFLVAGLTEWSFGDHEIITMIWFTIGLNFAIYNLSKEKEARSI